MEKPLNGSVWRRLVEHERRGAAADVSWKVAINCSWLAGAGGVDEEAARGGGGGARGEEAGAREHGARDEA